MYTYSSRMPHISYSMAGMVKLCYGTTVHFYFVPFHESLIPFHNAPFLIISHQALYMCVQLVYWTDVQLYKRRTKGAMGVAQDRWWCITLGWDDKRSKRHCVNLKATHPNPVNERLYGIRETKRTLKKGTFGRHIHIMRKYSRFERRQLGSENEGCMFCWNVDTHTTSRITYLCTHMRNDTSYTCCAYSVCRVWMDTQSLYNNVSYVCFDDSEYIYRIIWYTQTDCHIFVKVSSLR